VFAFALMIRGGIPTNEVEPYLHARDWHRDAARLLGRTDEELAAELVDGMLSGGAISQRDGRLYAAAEHTPVPADVHRLPFPREWV
jgi:hydroxyacylglutathione hydrolase